MERLQRTLGQKADDLAKLLESHVGIEGDLAHRFVQVAGADLLTSFAWQRDELNELNLADPRNARDLMSAAAAGRIAADVGLPVANVWLALRAFVPRVLQMAQSGRVPRAESMPWGEAAAARWHRRPAAVAAGRFMHPAD